MSASKTNYLTNSAPPAGTCHRH